MNCRHIELVVVGKHAHRIALPKSVPNFFEMTMRPVDDDFVGIRKPSLRRKNLACIANRDPIPHDLRDFYQRTSEIDRSKNQHMRGRSKGFDEDRYRILTGFTMRTVMTNTRTSTSKFSDCVANNNAIEIEVAECSLRIDSVANDQFGAEIFALNNRGQRNWSVIIDRFAPKFVDRVRHGFHQSSGSMNR